MGVKRRQVSQQFGQTEPGFLQLLRLVTLAARQREKVAAEINVTTTDTANPWTQRFGKQRKLFRRRSGLPFIHAKNRSDHGVSEVYTRWNLTLFDAVNPLSHFRPAFNEFLSLDVQALKPLVKRHHIQTDPVVIGCQVQCPMEALKGKSSLFK